jgi:DNA ligase (NAD+)
LTEDRSRLRISEISDLLRTYNHEYHVLNEPTVSDAEYDHLFDELSALEADFPAYIEPDSPTMRVGSDLSGDLPEAQHSVPVLSLDKAYALEEIDRWVEKTIRAAGRDLTFVVEEKIDGVSIVLYYEAGRLARAVTRGNGYVGNDVTANVKTIRAVPLRLNQDMTIAVRGEIYLPLDRFNELNARMETPYANPRNLAAGSLRRIRSSEVAAVPLQIFVYEGYAEGIDSHVQMLSLLGSLGFRLNPRLGYFSGDGDEPDEHGDQLASRPSSGTFDDIQSYISDRTLGRAALEYEIDGLVLKVNEIGVREELGYTGHHPRWEIAYKFESPEGITQILSIDVQVGRTGRITPVARVAPVQLGGTTVSNVTLHNQDYVGLLELSVGDGVAVSRRGDVIPAVERVVDKNDDGTAVWKMPMTCPSCSELLVIRGAHHFCENRECPDQLRGRLFFFVGKGQMDIDNLGPETIEVLIRNGFVRRVEDLYRFDYDRLLGMPGFGEKKVALVKKGIEESRTRPFRAVLPALGVPELGPKVTELLVEAGYATIDAILGLAEKGDPQPLLEIDGIGDKIAQTIIEELRSPELLQTIEALKEIGLTFSEDSTQKRQVSALFEDQVWCITGSFDHFKPRGLAALEVKARGGKTVTQVSGKTTHVLAGTNAGSKLTKAEGLGVRVVSEDEFLDLIGVDA